MLTYNFAQIGSDPLYLYLYKCIKNDILSGNLKANEKLPSKRAFAQNLGISVITIEGAYGQLQAEGYIYSLPKKGFYVSDISTLPKATDTPSLFKKSQHMQPESTKPLLADFTSNHTDKSIFPFTTWAKTMREIMSDKQEALMESAPCGGITELRESIAAHLRDFRGMYVKPEHIFIGAGSEYLYGLIIQLLGKDNLYGIEDPGYHKLAKICSKAELPCKYIKCDTDGLATEELVKKNITVMQTSPSHHFPTGKVMSVSRRYELLGWAADKDGRYIIEDDYDSELRMNGKPIPTLKSIDVSGRVIYINTFTKTLCSTVRIGYMILPEELAEKFYDELSFYSCTVSNFEQYTLAKFIENGSFEKHINRLRNFYQKKRDVLLETLQKHPLSKFISIHEEEAGAHFLMKINADKHQADVIQSALEKGVKLNPISDYYFDGKGPENVYVMNYSSIKKENIEKIVDVIYAAALPEAIK